MPVTPGPQNIPIPIDAAPNGFFDDDGNNSYFNSDFPGMERSLYITDRNGNQVKINTPADFQAIFDQMTPDEQERWKIQYRFCPVENNTKIPDYFGVPKDL